MPVYLSDLTDALAQTTQDQSFYFDPSDNTIHSDKEEIQNHWIALPNHREINDYGLMESFIETVTDATAKEWLTNAIHGRGAFRMFRATLDRFGLSMAWYAYKEQSYRFLAMDWCDDYGLAYTTAVEPLDAEDYDETEEELSSEEPVKVPLRFLRVHEKNSMSLLTSVSGYLKEMAQDNGDCLDEAMDQIKTWLKTDYVYACIDQERWIGFGVLHQDKDHVILSDLYILPPYRRMQNGTQLFIYLKEEARQIQDAPLHILIDPKDDLMIRFLAHAGYQSLARLEITETDHSSTAQISVDDHHFSY